MRLETTGGGNQYKVWLTDGELEELRRHAHGTRNDLILQLGGYVGLRAFEIPQVCPKHIQRTDDAKHYRLRVPSGKDTSGSGGKSRNAYLPHSLEVALRNYQRDNAIGEGEPFIDLTTSGVRAVVKQIATRTAEETGNDDYRHVSSHDLRRRFAQRLLVDEGMNPRVVMSIGGWESFEAVKPYLNTPSERVVNDAFEKVDVRID